MINRREFLGAAAGAGASMALAPQLLRAFQQVGGTLIQRAIPSTDETLPVVGLSFSNHPACADHSALREVLRTMVDNGGRVFDAMHGNAEAERFHAAVANDLGVQDKVFWSTRGTPGDGPAAPGADTVKTHVESLLGKLQVPRIDLVMLPPQADSTWLNAVKEEKKAGRVRYIGVQVIADARFPALESVMRNEPLDFIGVNYDVSSRGAEEKILPLARERKIAVMAFFPFSNNGGISCGNNSSNLFARVGTRPLPDWAAEFDAKTWAQFFLKYVVSHPAVTVARVGTTKAAHMLDNTGGGIGRLPDEAMRKRMAAFVDALPARQNSGAPSPSSGRIIAPSEPMQSSVALSAAILDSYVGDYKHVAAGTMVTIRRDGDKLMLNVQDSGRPEMTFVARSETRFASAIFALEFHLDGQGKVTGATWESAGPPGIAPQRIPLERK